MQEFFYKFLTIKNQTNPVCDYISGSLFPKIILYWNSHQITLGIRDSDDKYMVTKTWPTLYLRLPVRYVIYLLLPGGPAPDFHSGSSHTPVPYTQCPSFWRQTYCRSRPPPVSQHNGCRLPEFPTEIKIADTWKLYKSQVLFFSEFFFSETLRFHNYMFQSTCYLLRKWFTFFNR